MNQLTEVDSQPATAQVESFQRSPSESVQVPRSRLPLGRTSCPLSQPWIFACSRAWKGLGCWSSPARVCSVAMIYAELRALWLVEV